MAEPPVLREVALNIAAHLDGFRVIAEGETGREFHGWLWLVHNDGRRLWVNEDRTGRRMVITSALPPTAGGTRYACPEISLRMDRDPAQLAADIARRLLPDYGRVLATIRAEQARQARQEARQMALAKRVAARIPGARVRDTGGRTVVCWPSTSSHLGAQKIGSGELEFVGEDEVTLKIRWLPVAVADRLAAALAAAATER